jgi:hypothetical protein
MWQVFSCEYDYDADDDCDRNDLVDASYQLSLFLWWVCPLSDHVVIGTEWRSILHVVLTFFDFIALCQRSDVLGPGDDSDEDVW